MRTLEDPRRSTEPPSVARSHRPRPTPADALLALQRTGGNRATARLLSRFTDANKEQYKTAAQQVVHMQDLIDGILEAHKATFPFKGDRGPVLKPLKDQAEVVTAVLKEWEQTTDPDAEREVMKRCSTELKKAAALLPDLYSKLGNGDATGIKEAVANARNAVRARREAVEAEKRRQEQAAAQKAADDTLRGELAAEFTHSDSGPAYSPPPAAQLARFKEHVRLSHPAFSGLTLDQLRRPTCPLYLLTWAQLRRVEAFVGSASLSDWQEQNTPATRRDVLSFDRWMVPSEATTLKFKLGAEIFADWVVPRDGHGFSVMKLMEIWSWATRYRGAWMRVSRDGRKTIYEYVPTGKVETKLVTADNDTVLITCYDKRH